MAKRGRPKGTIQLTVGENSSLWRFASVEDALMQNRDLLAQLKHQGDSERPDEAHQAHKVDEWLGEEV